MNTGFTYGRGSFIDRLLEKQLSFVGVFFLVFFVSYLILVAVDFVPEPKISPPKVDEMIEQKVVQVNVTEQVTEDVNSEVVVEPQLPKSIYIERLDKTIEVLNPASRSVADLDRALLSGSVRHPDSARLGQTGTVFILGHSSYLPTVFNQNFKAFNGIQDLKWGDEIEVTSDDSVFVYRVDKVYRAEAEAVIVPIAGAVNKLTLATCDSFGATNDRFIVEATQVDTKPL